MPICCLATSFMALESQYSGWPLGSFYREPSKRIMVGGVKRHLVLFSCQVLASAGMGMGEHRG